jgi:alkylation response protein AidB-like acyl-CoA dehydrogenase
MDFELSDEHKMFQQTMRKFAEREVAPRVDEAEEKETFPVELFAKLGELGFLCPSYPMEYGGSELGKISDCILAEELGKVCSGICSGLMVQSGLATSTILKHGTEAQKQKYLVPAVKGKMVAAFGLSEPSAGSDAANIQTTAKRDGKDFIINGNKIYITNGPIASFLTLTVATDKSKGTKGISAIIVETNIPGYKMRKMRKVGHHSTTTADITYQDCRVTADNLVGEEGKGYKYILETLNGARISHSARSVGLAQACLEASINYAKERVQFGQPIGKNQAIAFKIARMAMEVEAARSLTYRIAWMFDTGHECRLEGPMTKLFASEVAIRTAEEAMRIHAGAGYLHESKIGRYFRDAILYHSTEGTSEIQQMVISRELGL